MIRLYLCVLVLVFTLTSKTDAQEYSYTLSVNGSFTTSSKLFHQPDASDETIRNQFYGIDNLYGAAADIRRYIETIGIDVGLSFEYIAKTKQSPVLLPNGRTVSVQDGFWAFPVELSAYFNIPLGFEKFETYLGGGVGFYSGFRNYRFAGFPSKIIGVKPNFGIHVLSGIQYEISSVLLLRTEIKFRNVQFRTSNKFERPYLVVSDFVVPLETDVTESRVNIDGMVLIAGLAVRL